MVNVSSAVLLSVVAAVAAVVVMADLVLALDLVELETRLKFVHQERPCHQREMHAFRLP